MSKPVDPRSPAIYLAVQRAALVLLKRETAVAEAVAVLADAIAAGDAGATPRENVKAIRQSRQEAMLAELERYEQQGRRTAAARLVARKFAADPSDRVELASLARKLRRWRDEKKGHCPSRPPNRI
jgi:hypothetical protein